LHLGFRGTSRFYLSLGGIAAGLCLASSIPGKQYLLGLVIAAPLYAVFYWRSLKRTVAWSSPVVIVYSFLAAATPILCYIIFNREHYTYYEGAYLHRFWDAVRGTPAPNDMRYYVTGLWNCFFAAHFWPRLLFPDFLPIPLPYYWLLLPGFVLALWQKRFEVVLLATLPAVGVFVTGGAAVEQRLLLAIPFWIILMSFTFAGLLKLRPWRGVQIVLGVLAGLILLDGFVPSIRYIYAKTKSPFSIRHYAQHEVAVSRFLKHVVAGQEHPDSPRLERDEFNWTKGIPEAPYDTLICQNDAYSIIHLFLSDYDDAKILSFCSGLPFFWIMTEQDVWNANKRSIVTYAPSPKDLKLIWERDPKTERIIRMFQSVGDLGTEDSLSLSFGGRMRRFYVLNIPNTKIRQLQERVRSFPATPELTSLSKQTANMFRSGKGQFDSPTAIAIDGSGNFFVADTGNGRIQKFSPTGAFITTIGTKENHHESSRPSGVAIDRAGHIYVADAGNHHVQKLAPSGTFVAEWKGAEPGFYGPRRIAMGPDDSIYVVDQGHTRIVKFSPDGGVLSTWGSKGTGDGQFDDPTSVAVDSTTNKVYVADPINKRIQIFDSNGKFLAKWSIPEWGQPQGFEDLGVDPKTGRLYASSANTDSVLMFDLNGKRVGSLTPKPPDRLERPSALALANGKIYVLNMEGNRVSIIDL
jgi:DNA-binding beta-propeller fold protein YncE